MSDIIIDEGSLDQGSVMTPPTDWKLEPGKRYMKGVLKDALISDPTLGLTAEDITAARTFAWHTILSRMAGFYNITGWETSPPVPLFQVWDLLASAYLVEIVAQRKNLDSEKTGGVVDRWTASAYLMLQRVIDPDKEGHRIYLLDPLTGSPLAKRFKIAVPKVVNITGVEFFPRDSETLDGWGRRLKGSVREFISDHSIITN